VNDQSDEQSRHIPTRGGASRRRISPAMTAMTAMTSSPASARVGGVVGRGRGRGRRAALALSSGIGARRGRATTAAASSSSLEDANGDAQNYRALTCALRKPLGLTLESGTGEVGAFVAKVNEDGAAKDMDAPKIEPWDVLWEVNGVDVRGMKFDDVLDVVIGADGDKDVELKFKRFEKGINATAPADRTWLEANSLKDGVTTLPSGLQYKVIRDGGVAKGRIAPETPCECHYAGTLIDGTEFDSSYKRGKPLTFAPKQVIRGWTEAMRRMGEGDKWELYIPSELAYGGRGSGRFIKPGMALLFTMSIERVL